MMIDQHWRSSQWWQAEFGAIRQEGQIRLHDLDCPILREVFFFCTRRTPWAFYKQTRPVISLAVSMRLHSTRNGAGSTGVSRSSSAYTVIIKMPRREALIFFELVRASYCFPNPVFTLRVPPLPLPCYSKWSYLLTKLITCMSVHLHNNNRNML